MQGVLSFRQDVEPPRRGRVALLPEDVVNKIAAGEVLERPASALKEMLENALDAGATHIHVMLEEGGLHRLIVTDNGAGMSQEDLYLCILRHATSKIKTDIDLLNIRTMGFRGEALSSIAAVSKMVITTRLHHESMGRSITVEAGLITQERTVACSPGTSIDIQDLFYNTPARRKFMKAPATEQAHCLEAALRVMLAARQGGIIVETPERRLLDIREDVPEDQRLRSLFGEKVKQLYGFDKTMQDIRVSGYMAEPSVFRSDSRGIFVFVNQRFVRDKSLQRAVQEGFRHVLERGFYPYVALYVDVPPDVVDVNVHPQKIEVRFQDASTVFRAVHHTLTAAVAQSPWAAHSDIKQAKEGLSASKLLLNKHQGMSHPAPSFTNHEQTSFLNTLPVSTALPFLMGRKIEPYFWLLYREQETWALDARKFWLQCLEHLDIELKPYVLVLPDVVPFRAEHIAFLDKHWERLPKIGFEIEPVGPQRYAVRSVPTLFQFISPTLLALDIIDVLAQQPAEHDEQIVRNRLQHLPHHLFQTFKISSYELDALFKQWFEKYPHVTFLEQLKCCVCLTLNHMQYIFEH